MTLKLSGRPRNICISQQDSFRQLAAAREEQAQTERVRKKKRERGEGRAVQGACGRECAAVATKLKARATKTDAMQTIFPGQKLLLRFCSHSASSFSSSSSSSPSSSTASAAAEAALMKAIKNSREKQREGERGRRKADTVSQCALHKFVA